jgi:hypothetical protein
MTDALQMPGVSDCLGRTCMQWGSAGELAALDLCWVLERLDSNPCSSMSCSPYDPGRGS